MTEEPMKIPHRSLHEQLSDSLREKIRSGELAADEPLREEKLATQFGVSRTPMRQALFALAEEGVLAKQARQSFTVLRTPDPAASVSRASGGAEAIEVQAFEAPTLGNQVADTLRERILSGELSAGRVVREVALASELGVSRTPIREGLLSLEREGFVRKTPRKGFRVSPLEAREVRELYPLRALLETQALRESGAPSAANLDELEQLNDRLRQEPAGIGWVRLDNEWHDRLVSGCTNQHLQKILGGLREHSLRYEIAYLQTGADPQSSTGQHREILASFRKGNLDGACATLAENMTVGMDSLLAWLENLPAAEPSAFD